ncbi:MAG: VWA domain-containing protein [Candidatus Bipolaricaulaceae bacterium]
MLMRLLNPLALLALLPAALLASWALWRNRRLVGRALTLTVLAVGLAGPQLAMERQQETLWVLVDRSASVGPAAGPATEQLRRLLAGRPAQVGVIDFAASPQVVRPPSAASWGELAPASVPALATDIAAAIDLALQLSPPGPAQILLLSDGRATEGDARAALVRAGARGVPVSTVPVGRTDPVRLVSFTGPHRPPQGVVELTAAVRAEEAVDAEVVLTRDQTELAREDVSLAQGTARLTFTDRPPGAGAYVYSLWVDVPDDPVPENNRLSLGLVVGTPPPVLVVGPAPSGVDALLTALEIPFRRTAILTPAALTEAKLVVLDDMPLGGLGPSGLDALRAFVSGGGGMWAVLGRRAVQGYAGPVEDLMPVSFAVPEGVQESKAAVAFVLDRSASMAGRSRGVPKIDLLKEAVAAAVEIMPADDTVAAVAFDRQVHELLPPVPVEEGEGRLYSGLRALTATGGTDLYPAVAHALDALAASDARVRHVILISDGRTVREGRDFPALYDRLAASGVGMTAIGVGEDPDTEVLAHLARAGGGQLLLLPDAAALPQVLLRETQRVVRPRFVEGEVQVIPGPAAGALDLLDADLPPLAGYVLTFPKPTAQVALVSQRGDPVLALWQVGLGQVAALTVDLAGGWSQAWLEHPTFARLGAALIGRLWTDADPVQVLWQEEEGYLRITADVQQGGRWVDGLQLAGELVGERATASLTLAQVSPGRYETRVPLPLPGAQLLTLAEPGGRFGGTFPVNVSYRGELAGFGADLESLAQLARLGGGILVTDEVLPPPAGSGRRYLPLQGHFLWAAAGLFLADLALRKLVS